MAKKIFKIVVTGGPCGGKSTGMSWIQNAFTKRGYKVIFVAETATELINSGVSPRTVENRIFQLAQSRIQHSKQYVYEKIAEELDCDKVLIVFDRGVLDGKAFCNEGVFEQVIQDANKTEVELRDYYDAVFHLVTAAKGAEKFYTLENNAARSETIEEARILDDNCIEVWTGHPHFRIIGNEGSFEDKMKHLISEIAKVLGEPELAEAKKKYLIELPEASILEKMKKVEIYQSYLKCDDDEKIQIRKRGEGEDFIYSQIKTRIQDNQIIKAEKRLTQAEYQDKLVDVDQTRKPLHRTRFCFSEQSQYMEIDIYPFWNDKAILSIDLSKVDDEVHLPNFVKVIEDITNKKEYLNSELSKL